MPSTMARIIVTASDTFDLVPCGSRARRKIGGDALQSTTYGTSPRRYAPTVFISRAIDIRPPRKIIDERALVVREILKPIAAELSYCAPEIWNFSPTTIISCTVAWRTVLRVAKSRGAGTPAGRVPTTKKKMGGGGREKRKWRKKRTRKGGKITGEEIVPREALGINGCVQENTSKQLWRKENGTRARAIYIYIYVQKAQ